MSMLGVVMIASQLLPRVSALMTTISVHTYTEESEEMARVDELMRDLFRLGCRLGSALSSTTRTRALLWNERSSKGGVIPLPLDSTSYPPLTYL